MTMINIFVQLLFIGIAINCVIVTVLVYRSKNGLKREVLWFFCALTAASVARVVEAALPPHIIASNVMSIVVALPILVTGTKLARVLSRPK